MFITATERSKTLTHDQIVALAAALERTPYEVRGRVMGEGGASVVSVVADETRARQTASALHSAGLPSLILSGAVEAKRFATLLDARSIGIEADCLSFVSRNQTRAMMTWNQIRALVFFADFSHRDKTETALRRDFRHPLDFAFGSGMLTTGLKIKSKTKAVQARERCLLVVSDNGMVLIRESAVDWSASLGEDLAASREANLRHVVNALVARCQEAVFDDTMLRRVSQEKLLGSVLTPETETGAVVSLHLRHLMGDFHSAQAEVPTLPPPSPASDLASRPHIPLAPLPSKDVEERWTRRKHVWASVFVVAFLIVLVVALRQTLPKAFLDRPKAKETRAERKAKQKALAADVRSLRARVAITNPMEVKRMRYVDRRMTRLKDCHANVMEEGQMLHGTLTFTLDTSDKGKVALSNFEGIENDALRQCVRKALEQARLPMRRKSWPKSGEVALAFGKATP